MRRVTLVCLLIFLLPAVSPAQSSPQLLGGDDLGFLLLDRFTTALPAGSVHGSPMEPGGTLGSVRLVHDTAGTRLALAGGAMRISNPSAWGNPAYRMPAVTRVAGRTLFVTVHPVSGTSMFLVGWDSNTTKYLRSAVSVIYTGGLRSWQGTAETGDIGSWVLGSPLQLALVLRKNGMFTFARGGGVYPEWRLLRVSDDDSTATLYPGVSPQGYRQVFEIDDMAVPDTTWLPVPLGSDAFSREDGALGSTDGQGHVEDNGGRGLPWTSSVGTWGVASEQAQALTLDSSVAVATVSLPSVNVWVQSTLTWTAGVVGLVVRYQNPSNYIWAGHDGTTAMVVKRVAGIETTVASSASAFGAGEFKVTMTGTCIYAFWDDASIGTSALIAGDSSLQTGTRVGLYTTDTGNTHDAVVAWGTGP